MRYMLSTIVATWLALASIDIEKSKKIVNKGG